MGKKQKSNQVKEVTVYGKKKYADELKKQQAKYLADMSKYKKDSAQWVTANNAYQDSLRLYNNVLDMATDAKSKYANSRAAETRAHLNEVIRGKGVKFWKEAKKKAIDKGETDVAWYDTQIEKANNEVKVYSNLNKITAASDDTRKEVMQNFNLGDGYQLKHGKNKYKDRYDYPSDGYFYTNMIEAEKGDKANYSDYLDAHIQYREAMLQEAINKNRNNVTVSGMAATTREGASAEINNARKLKKLVNNPINPIGYTSGLEQLQYPIYKKPTNEIQPPLRPTGANVKYDDTYENLNMRSLWANIAKQDTSQNIGTLHNLDRGFKKGFTINEAVKFPQEVKDKYNIDLIHNQVNKEFKYGGNVTNNNNDMATKRKVNKRSKKAINKKVIPYDTDRLITGTPPIPSLPLAKGAKVLKGIKDFYTNAPKAVRALNAPPSVAGYMHAAKIPATAAAVYGVSDIISNDIGMVNRDGMKLSLNPRFSNARRGDIDRLNKGLPTTEFKLGGNTNKRMTSKTANIKPNVDSTTLAPMPNKAFSTNEFAKGRTYIDEYNNLMAEQDGINTSLKDSTISKFNATQLRGRYNEINQNITDLYDHQNKNFALGGIASLAIKGGTAIYKDYKANKEAKYNRLEEERTSRDLQYENDQLYLDDFNSTGSKVGYYAKGGMHKANARAIGNKKNFKPMGDNVYELKGPSHANGGINIGNGGEAQGNEVVKITPDGVKVLSNEKEFFGYSPANQVKRLAGAGVGSEFERQYAMQEATKGNKVANGNFVLGGEQPEDYDDADAFNDTVDNGGSSVGNEAYGGDYNMIPGALNAGFNALMVANTPKVPRPTPTPLVNLDSNLDFNPELNAVNANARDSMQYVNRNISDSNTAAALGIKLGNQATTASNAIRSKEMNAELGIRNNEAKANITPNMFNAKQTTDYGLTKMQRQLGIKESLNKISRNITDGVVDLQDKNRLDNKDKDRMTITLYNNTDGSLSESIRSGAFDSAIFEPNFNPNSLHPENLKAYNERKMYRNGNQ